mmetsp:Transcript_31493/g.60020  ORF Transcript_31493/g.60020 Transcript_31493/m.60020 type:complete len:245 (-) Transcript_31493:705-1439(-)
MTRVSEVVNPLLATQARLRLSHFIIMVRKLEIFPTGVNVKHFPQNICRDDRAFNVPSWAARPKGRLPSRLTSLACLPECKVIGVAFFARFAAAKGALALSHLRRRCSRAPRPRWTELTIVVTCRLKGVQIEIDRSITLVRKTVIDNFLHKGNDLGHVLGNTRQNIWLTNAQRIQILHKLPFVLSCMRIEYRVIGDQMTLLSIQFLGKDRLGRHEEIGTRILCVGRGTAGFQNVFLVLIQILPLD